MAFANVSDIEARWRELSDEETARADVLINDASAMLARLVEIDPNDETQAELLTATCANMVIRAMSATELDTYGVDSATITAGPYSQTFSYTNTTGDLYLTRAERALLGVGAYIGTIPPKIGGVPC